MEKKLSAVLIVKNESEMLAKCLDSIKGVDEIIIVDTGSIDNTVEIALKYTDKVFSFEWCDDFAKARNFAKEYASNDWILSIDADEEMQGDGIAQIKELINSEYNPADAIVVQMWNGKSDKTGSVRVFRKTMDWKGRIHEVIVPNTFIETDISIKYGRSPAHDIDPDVDLRILRKCYEEDPKSTRNLFYFARELYYYKQWEEAEEKFLEYISLGSNHFSEVTEAYYLLAECYWYDGKGNGEKSREALMKVIMRNVNFKAAYLLMAQQMIDNNKMATWLRFASIADNSNVLFIR